MPVANGSLVGEKFVYEFPKTRKVSDPPDMIELEIEFWVQSSARPLKEAPPTMCLPGQPPATAGEALWAISAGLDYLNAADVASLTTAEQAGCLRALEQATARHTAARSRVLAAFHAQDGCAGDGHRSTRTWLRWQTRISGGAASDAISWMRRLPAHPAVAGALAAGRVSASWARHICEWTDVLPADYRSDADQILLGAAAGGAELRDLSDLAEEIR